MAQALARWGEAQPAWRKPDLIHQSGELLPDALLELADRWHADLSAWAGPEQITAGVGEPPWELPRQVFAAVPTGSPSPSRAFP
jgi:hypothetical protein